MQNWYLYERIICSSQYTVHVTTGSILFYVKLKLCFCSNIQIKETGMTGNIEFDTNGMRKNMPLKIVNLRKSNFEQVGPGVHVFCCI